MSPVAPTLASAAPLSAPRESPDRGYQSAAPIPEPSPAEEPGWLAAVSFLTTFAACMLFAAGRKRDGLQLVLAGFFALVATFIASIFVSMGPSRWTQLGGSILAFVGLGGARMIGAYVRKHAPPASPTSRWTRSAPPPAS